VTVRDDASTDRTLAVLSAMARADPRVTVTQGERLGAARSFMHLLTTHSGGGRWFAFADQDDVWLPDKLARAVRALAAFDDRPAVYGAVMLQVSERLRPLERTGLPRHVGFRNAVVQNVIPGCTMLFNRAARALAIEHTPDDLQMHDWWVYLVVTAFGSVVFDEHVSILHRVHTGNATSAGLWHEWPRRIVDHLARPKGKRPSRTVQAFYEAFGERLDPDRKALVERLLALPMEPWTSRLRFATEGSVERQTRTDNAILALLLTLGRF
jgi:glycosyltransferase involved in cell wall biosynthesis